MKNPFSRSENNRRRIPEEDLPEYPGSHSRIGLPSSEEFL
jgi:hypothetical protein